MGVRHGASSAILSALLATVRAQNSGNPLSIPFNTSIGGYGPDGPWNFISLNIGSDPASLVDFYPTFQAQNSLLVASDVCGKSKCMSPQPGYYNFKAASASKSSVDVNTSSVSFVGWGTGLTDQVGLNGSGHYWVDNIDTADLDKINGSDIAFYVSDDAVGNLGTATFAPLSLLSLEPSTSDNVTKLSGGGNASCNTLLEQYHSSTGGSNTVSLHYGSAAFNQSGSLVFGGYDPSRLIEPPAIFDHLGFFPLGGISFGNADGSKPWPPTSNLPTNFLGDPLQVLFEPQSANIHLPAQVCSSIAQYLPVTYNSTLNLYLWNTSSPLYHNIVTSLSYMNFTLGDDRNTSIKVPFALLNLTLTPPLVNEPIPYFPCYADDEASVLGRAFLQAAFLMQAYGDDSFLYIGQAPGPSVNQNTKTTLATLSQSNPDAQPGSNSPAWSDTWTSTLKALSSGSSLNSGSGSGSGSNGSSGGSQLSGGAIAGVVIGVLAAVALIAGAAVFFIRKRRAATVSPSIATESTNHNRHLEDRPFSGGDMPFSGPSTSIAGITAAGENAGPKIWAEKNHTASESAGSNMWAEKDHAAPAAPSSPSAPSSFKIPIEVPVDHARHEIDTSQELHEMPADDYSLPTGGHYGQAFEGKAFEMADTSVIPEMPGSSIERLETATEHRHEGQNMF